MSKIDYRFYKLEDENGMRVKGYNPLRTDERLIFKVYYHKGKRVQIQRIN